MSSESVGPHTPEIGEEDIALTVNSSKQVIEPKLTISISLLAGSIISKDSNIAKLDLRGHFAER